MTRPFVIRKYQEASKLVKPNSSILDVGCEDGFLRNFIKPKNYVGIDVEKENIEKLKKEGVKVYPLDLNNYKSIPIKQKFDYIFFLDVLEHVINPAKVIQDFKKLLNKDGKIIVSLPNDYHILNKLRFLLNRNISEFPFWEHGHLHTFPINEGKKFLEEQNLRIIKMKYLAPEEPRFFPPSLRKFLANLLPNNFARIVIYELSLN